MSKTGLYKLILVWRGLKKTVPYDHGHYINDKIILLFFYICFIQNIIINNTLYHRLSSGCFCTYQIYSSSHSYIVCTHSFFAFTQQHVHISILSFTLTRFFFVYIRCYSFFHHHSSILSDFYTLHCQ